MVESLQHKLDRVRKPRVQITYDVEIGDAIVKKELPFVVGILAVLAGHQGNPLPPLKKRKFIEIDRDNFDHIMEGLSPRLTLRVDNKINPADEHLSVELFFKSMTAFDPVEVVKQVPAMGDIYESRVYLKDMLAKLDGNDPLDHLLHQVMQDPSLVDRLLKEMDNDSGGTPPNKSGTKANSTPNDNASDGKKTDETPTEGQGT